MQSARSLLTTPHTARALLSLTALVGALTVSPAFAADDADLGGLSVGEQAPRFTIPVVNDGFTAAKKWGPNKWVGETSEKKLVVMSFFSIYCEPCKKEIPELVRMHEKYKDQGLGVMLVAIDKEPDELPQVQQIARDNQVVFPVVHDKYNMVARRYRLKRIPYMLMIGTDGNVKAVHVGYTEELKASLENEVRGHLGLAPLEPAPVEATPKEPDMTTTSTTEAKPAKRATTKPAKKKKTK